MCMCKIVAAVLDGRLVISTLDHILCCRIHAVLSYGQFLVMDTPWNHTARKFEVLQSRDVFTINIGE